MKRFAISMKTDWIFDGIEAWINEGNGRMAKIWGDSTVAHFASKVSYSASPQTSAECPREAACSHVVHANL